MPTPSRNPLAPGLPLLEESFRWYGPSDPVPLAHIRQTGARSVFTALHEIPYGEVWPPEAIRERKAMVEAAGLEWTAVESVPIHEDIKTGWGGRDRHIAHYAQTLRNLGAAGIRTVIYNFMPVLEWVRTDMAYPLADGSTCLRFDVTHFAAFEVCALKRPGARDAYTPAQLQKAEAFYAGLDEAGKKAFVAGILDMFPGNTLKISLADMRQLLEKYQGIDRAKLKENLRYFLRAVAPAAEEAGIRLAIHPDDPPYPILGLPRILSTGQDIADLIAMTDSPNVGVCFCSGSFSARADNDLPAMIRRHAHRIFAAHIRVTRREADGSFYEDNHLEGSADMPAVVQALLDEQNRRRQAGDDRWQIAFRPDHGHTMMDDLDKPQPPNPGYACIGRMRGLAEIRGLQLGLARAKWGAASG